MRLHSYVRFSLGLIHKLLGSLYYLVHIHSCQIEQMPVFLKNPGIFVVIRKIDIKTKLKLFFSHDVRDFHLQNLTRFYSGFCNTVLKVSRCGVISGPYFPVFRPVITPYLGTFHKV